MCATVYHSNASHVTKHDTSLFSGKSSSCDDGRDIGRSTSDEQMKEYLGNVAEVKQEEWDTLGSDFEMVLSDCPENANCEGQGPYSCSGWVPTGFHCKPLAAICSSYSLLTVLIFSHFGSAKRQFLITGTCIIYLLNHNKGSIALKVFLLSVCEGWEGQGRACGNVWTESGWS